MKKIILLIALIILFLFDSQAKVDTSRFESVKVEQQSNANGEESRDPNIQNLELNLLSSYEFYLSLIILIFGLFAILIEVWLIHKKKIDQENTLKFIVITLIITATLFLITAGYSNNQIAPAMGLLGTIAGYLLGKSKSKTEAE